MLEFALCFPLLLLLCLGATDFGRLFFHAVTVSNAAATGAFYGAQSNVASAQIAVMESRATEDAGDLTGVTATATRFCECPGDPPAPISCAEAANTSACSGYGAPRAYVRTDASQTFQTLAPYPGIPSSTSVGRNAFMRVQ
jgi:Flp pilus assembly protein TadG